MNGLVSLTDLSLPQIFHRRAARSGHIPFRLRDIGALPSGRVSTLAAASSPALSDRGGALALERASLTSGQIDATGHGTIAAAGGSSDFLAVASTQDLSALTEFSRLPCRRSRANDARGPVRRDEGQGHVQRRSCGWVRILGPDDLGRFFGGARCGASQGRRARCECDAVFLALGRWTANTARAKISYGSRKSVPISRRDSPMAGI